MTSFSSLLASLVAPWWAALIVPGTLVLWWVYRSGDTTRERVLGSTMLLERARLVSRSVKWRPPWRALLEALLLLAIIAALLELRLPSSAQTMVLAIDNGPRMAAALAGKSSVSLFERAKAEAIVVLGALADDTRVAITTLSDQTEPLTVSDALRRIPTLQLSYQSGVIEDAAARLRANIGASQATVIGDGTFALPKPDWLTWISVSDQPRDNLALADFDTKNMALSIVSYAQRETAFILAITDQSGTLITNRQGTIAPGATRRVSLADIKNLPSSGAITMQAAQDALRLDDTYYFASGEPAGTIVVDSPLTIAELGLATLPQLTFVTRRDFKRGLHAEVAELIHRGSDQSSAQISECHGRRLIVAPGGLPTSRTAERVVWWSEAEDLLRYVNLDLLSLPLVSVLPKTDAAILIETRSGPVMTRSVQAGCEAVTVGFELFPFTRDGSKTVSILTLNALSWLSQKDRMQSGAWRIPPESVVSRILPSLEATLQAGDVVNEPGLFAVTRRGVTQTMARSFVNSLASDLRTVTVHRAPSAQDAQISIYGRDSAVMSSRSASEWALWGALMLVVLDIALFLGRQARALKAVRL